ncbi:hypothetical protein [Luteolibacter sp. LG18]|uniref:hypothetical protein n=1 Tax=Luteolibacter sp. LG18 TaxID=2819286 RepID=UPI002B2F1F34|nr:hypothetical protein llg_06990 [Luteolibacter sp. LG18]BCU79672.1 hypothetical protein llg_43870 [Luteolibacter sp. LG18]
MTPTFMLEADLIGALVFFVEDGTEVDSLVVGETVIPDFTPISNWPSLGNIQESGFSNEGTDDPFYRVMPSGKQIKVPRKWTNADMFAFTADEMHELSWRLQMGLPSRIVLGTAQSPGTLDDRQITGWLYVQGRKGGKGADRFRFIWRVQLRLQADIKIGQKSVKGALIAHKIDELDAESVVFPDLG